MDKGARAKMLASFLQAEVAVDRISEQNASIC